MVAIIGDGCYSDALGFCALGHRSDPIHSETKYLCFDLFASIRRSSPYALGLGKTECANTFWFFQSS
jgi:hypothetical protein